MTVVTFALELNSLLDSNSVLRILATHGAKNRPPSTFTLGKKVLLQF